MDFLLCRHIKTNGLQCQSPALRSGEHCFFHNRLYQRHAGFRYTPESRGNLVPGRHIELAPLEDRDSIQVALSVVINALATGQLETSRATAILYGLQLASSNATRLNTQPYAPDVVRSATTSPDGIDLAEPGATRHVADFSEFNYDESDYEADDEED